MQYTGIIYKYTDPFGKSYIGQTTNPQKRKQQHKSTALGQPNIKDFYSKFHTAIRELGWDSFQYEVLKTIVSNSEQELSELLNEAESYYIGKYDTFDNGYNMTIGGKALRGENHPSYGKTLSKEHAKKLKDSRVQEVSQYSATGEFIKTYYSASEAAKQLNIDASGIIKACKGKVKHSGNYQWRYGHSIEPLEPLIDANIDAINSGIQFKNGCKPIYQYDLEYNLVKIWESMKSLQIKGYSSRHINMCFKGELDNYGKKGQPKYIWSHYPIDRDHIIQVPDKD